MGIEIRNKNKKYIEYDIQYTYIQHRCIKLSQNVLYILFLFMFIKLWIKLIFYKSKPFKKMSNAEWVTSNIDHTCKIYYQKNLQGCAIK